MSRQTLFKEYMDNIKIHREKINKINDELYSAYKEMANYLSGFNEDELVNLLDSQIHALPASVLTYLFITCENKKVCSRIVINGQIDKHIIKDYMIEDREKMPEWKKQLRIRWTNSHRIY